MAYVNQIAEIPGLTPEQVIGLNGLMTILSASLNKAFDKHFGPLQPSTSPPVQPVVTTARPEIQKKKQKRNEKTRLQYKRRKALHVTMQPSVKEVEHASQIRVEQKPRKHVVLERTKPVPWDWSIASLWCWYAVIPMKGMIMVRDGGTSGMHRIGIG